MSENFHEGHWGQCLELLSHLCQYSDSIILVTGPAGIGKTAMKKELSDTEKDNFTICDVRATSTLTSEHLTMRIEQDFDEYPDQDLLVLIDDAQNLTLEVMSVLLQLKQKTAVLGKLHIALFATPELEQKISRSVLKEDFADQVHNIEIEPFTIDEVEAFLTHKWHNTHEDGDIPLDKSKLKKIHLLSGGIIGKVEQIASDIMNGKKITKMRDQQPGLSPFMVGVTVSFGILFCVLAIMWPASDSDMIKKTEQFSQPLTIASDEVVAEIEPEAISVTDVIAVAEQSQAETQPAAQSQIVVASAALDPYEQKIAELEKKVNELQIELASEQKAQRATESKLQQLLTGQQSVAIHAAKKSPTKKAASKNTISKNTLGKKTLRFSKNEKHILSLPGNNYTLQLLCLNNEGQVQDFIKDHNLQNKAHYYKSNFKDKNWYIVVYGSYSSKTAADMAVATLPAELKKLHPWPRPYSNIHNSIKNR